MRHSLYSYALVALAAAAAAPAAAQDAAAPPTETAASGVGVFGALGLGVASSGFGGVLSLSVHSSRNAFVARASGASEFTLLSPSDTAEDFAFLYGRVRERGAGWLRAAVGPALVRVTRDGDPYDCVLFFCLYELEESYHPGLAFQAEAVWTPAGILGLGATAFANVNPEMSYAGLALGVHLGRVRRR
jgi:hypothetical protein